VQRRFPTFGLKKVRDWLRRFVGLKVSAGSVRKVVVAAGLPRAVPPKRRRTPARPRRFERAAPGELWQTDITYLPVPWHKGPLYLIAFLDDCSRFVVGWGHFSHPRQEIALEVLEGAILRFGRPQEVLSDQGRQFFAWRGKSAFQKLLAREGIAHVVARAHHPQTLGKVERLWETVKREFWDRVRPRDLEEARERLKHFFAHYNHFRPHQSLEGQVPADRFFSVKEEVRRAVRRGSRGTRCGWPWARRRESPCSSWARSTVSRCRCTGSRGGWWCRPRRACARRSRPRTWGSTRKGRWRMSPTSKATTSPTTTTTPTGARGSPPPASGAPEGRRRRRGLKRLRFRVPRMPAPVRALWEGASGEERERAHRVAVQVLATWLRRASREEAARELGVPVLRFWQLSQQAVAGLVAGCLKQPRYRGPASGPASEGLGVLRQRIALLERELDEQRRLIGVLKDLPAHRESGEGSHGGVGGRRRGRAKGAAHGRAAPEPGPATVGASA
jgi:transposase InsO family protein